MLNAAISEHKNVKT
jgi:hypothetical protein